jgi:UDP-N-acetyl-D-glucosamine dehydrogenase
VFSGVAMDPKKPYPGLAAKLISGDFSVAVVGMGYVGLPLALAFLEKNIRVIGIDVSENRVNDLKNALIPFTHLATEGNKSLLLGGLFECTISFERVREVDAVIVCVPTPISKNLAPNLTYVMDACVGISQYIDNEQLIVLESTTYPGTTEELIVPLVESKGFTVGNDLYIGYSPEREDPANSQYNTRNIPKIVSGVTSRCLECTTNLYAHIISSLVPVSSTKVAELTKLVENIHRSVNIGLMNELKPLCVEMGIDIFEVIKAASTKPFGFTPYYPGPGLGGHCIPIDPFYLAWKAKEYGVNTRFIELAGEINTEMPSYVVSRIGQALNNLQMSIRGSSILLLGLAYKKNIEDTRSSPSILVFEKLNDLGANVKYVDPFIPELSLKTGSQHSSCVLDRSLLEFVDVTVLLTDHDIFDYEFILKYSKSVVDTRGRYALSDKVIRA